MKLTLLGRLTAADGRRIKGCLLPFGKPGYTNLGRVVVGPDDVEIPEDLSTLFASLDHLDDRDPVATYAVLEKRADGLYAEWDVPKTHGGDKLLAEYRAGKRTGISVELEPVTIKDGVARGRLIGNAFPVEPAFADARLVAELAPDTEAFCVHDDGSEHPAEIGDDGLAVSCDATDQPAPQTTDADPGDGTDAQGTEPPADPEGDPVKSNLVVRASAAAAGTGPSPQRLTAANATPQDVYALFAALKTSTSTGRQQLLAALNDVIPGNILDREQPAWLNEVWSGKRYQRRFVPLLQSAPLTGMRVKGWRWVTKPAMGRYNGDKTAIPSNAVSTEEYNEEAQRFAGGHDIDRKYVDFNDTAFFTAYFDAMSESYARETDLYTLERLKSSALPVTPGTVPADVPAGWGAVVDGALSMIDIGTPAWALIEKSVYRDMLFTGTDKFLEFLNASIGFEEGTLNSSNFKLVPVESNAVGGAASTTGLDVGEVLVGCREAGTYRELGGGTPIRVDALDIANGGIDEGCFGYAHVDIYDNRGLALVDLTADV